MRTKKELKNEYKQMKPTMGVFQIKNQVNGKTLVEGSTNVVAKWNRHQSELEFGNHRNLGLQRDWKEFGSKNFVFEILSELEPKEDESMDYNQELKLLEDMMLKELNISEDLRY